MTPACLTWQRCHKEHDREHAPSVPLACRVLQYVHAPRHPVESGMISTNGFLRTFGRLRLGSCPDFLPSNRTHSPCNVLSTTSTMRSSCAIPTSETPSPRELRSLRLRSAFRVTSQTQPGTEARRAGARRLADSFAKGSQAQYLWNTPGKDQRFRRASFSARFE